MLASPITDLTEPSVTDLTDRTGDAAGIDVRGPDVPGIDVPTTEVPDTGVPGIDVRETGVSGTDLREVTGATPHERHDPFCLPPEELADLLASARWRRLAVIGDSIASGVGDPVPGYRDVSWADRLADALRRREAWNRNDRVPLTTLRRVAWPVAYLNLGVRGLRAREIRETQLDRTVAFGPDLVVVTAGGNDMLARSFDAASVETELDTMVGALAGRGAQVVTFGLLDLSRTLAVPDGMRADLRRRLVALNEVTRRVTARHDGLYVDFFDDPAFGDDLLSADMIHANRRGHAHIAAVVGWALAGRRRRVT